MRIVHLDSGREMRGGQWQVLHLVKGCGGVLLCPQASPLFEKARAAELDVRPLSWWSVAMAKADIVHAHDARSHTMAVLTARAPVVVARRVSFPVNSQWKYRRAAHYIAVSEFVRGVLLAHGIPDAKISVVYDGVVLREATPVGDRVLALESSDPMKGNELAREACDLAGVALHETRDLDSDLGDARCLLYLSFSEGLGSGALAAMSAGIPVVASRTGGLPEIVLDGDDGLLVSNQVNAVALGICRMTENLPMAQRMGTRARQKIEERFTIDIMVQRTRQVYERVLG